MGQLFNRLTRYAKSMVNPPPERAYHVDENFDDDLKKIIDELNRVKTENKKSSGPNSNYENRTSEAMSIEKACSILGVAANSSIDEIKSAYKQKIKEYHPDKVAFLGGELVELAKKKTQEINEAYAFLEIAKEL